jgi:hypothetical protein
MSKWMPYLRWMNSPKVHLLRWALKVGGRCLVQVSKVSWGCGGSSNSHSEHLTTQSSSPLLLDANKLLSFFNQTCTKGNVPLPRVGILGGSLCSVLPKGRALLSTSYLPIHKSIKVALNNQELGHDELSFIHHFNPMIPSFDRHEVSSIP